VVYPDKQSKIEPIKKAVPMLRRRRALLLNWLRGKGHLSRGVVQGFNAKAKLISRKSFGFRI
jgi:transposase